MSDCEKCHESEHRKEAGKCPPKVIQINNPHEPVLFHRVDIPAILGNDETYPPKVGLYRNVLLVYEANDHAYMYSSDGVPTLVSGVPQEIWDDLAELKDGVDELEAADVVIQQEIDDLKNSPDVVDIVATYAALQAYDTSALGDKDVIRVLTDETHDNESTYYRWDKPNSQWTFIGAVEGYYTKAQTDILLAAKQNALTAGDNIQIRDDVISATDTTYGAGYGLALNGTQFSVDTSTIQGKLTAGSNIQINDATISAADTTYSAGTGLSLTGTEFAVDTSVIAEVSDIPTKTSELTNDGSAGTDTYVESGTLANYQEKLAAGSNITIASDNTISATNTTYTAGTGLSLVGTEFSVDTTTIATQTDLSTKQDALTAGTGISIVDESGALVISATGAQIATISAQDWSALWQ